MIPNNETERKTSVHRVIFLPIINPIMKDISKPRRTKNVAPVVVLPKKTYPCKHCDKVFKHSSSLYRHIKSSCQKNKDVNISELFQLITEKYNQIENMQKQIDFLTNKIQNQETNSF